MNDLIHSPAIIYCRLFGTGLTGARCGQITAALFLSKGLAAGLPIDIAHRRSLFLVGAK